MRASRHAGRRRTRRRQPRRRPQATPAGHREASEAPAGPRPRSRTGSRAHPPAESRLHAASERWARLAAGKRAAVSGVRWRARRRRTPSRGRVPRSSPAGAPGAAFVMTSARARSHHSRSRQDCGRRGAAPKPVEILSSPEEPTNLLVFPTYYIENHGLIDASLTGSNGVKRLRAAFLLLRNNSREARFPCSRVCASSDGRCFGTMTSTSRLP